MEPQQKSSENLCHAFELASILFPDFSMHLHCSEQIQRCVKKTIVSLSPVMILPDTSWVLHILPKYFVLQGICNVSTSKCPWQMQCAITLHPSPPPSYFVPRAQNARLLGEVPTNSDFGAAKRRRGSMQELRINK